MPKTYPYLTVKLQTEVDELNDLISELGAIIND